MPPDKVSIFPLLKSRASAGDLLVTVSRKRRTELIQRAAGFSVRVVRPVTRSTVTNHRKGGQRHFLGACGRVPFRFVVVALAVKGHARSFRRSWNSVELDRRNVTSETQFRYSLYLCAR